MSERVMLEVSMTVQSETDDEPTFKRLVVRVSGAIRRHALNVDADLAARGMQEVIRIDTVVGEPVLVIVNRESSITERTAWIGPEETEMSSSTPAIKVGEVVEEPGIVPGIGAPPLLLESNTEHAAEGGYGLYGTLITSAPWGAGEYTVYLQEGDFRMYLLEFEAGTVSVEVEGT